MAAFASQSGRGVRELDQPAVDDGRLLAWPRWSSRRRCSVRRTSTGWFHCWDGVFPEVDELPSDSAQEDRNTAPGGRPRQERHDHERKRDERPEAVGEIAPGVRVARVGSAAATDDIVNTMQAAPTQARARSSILGPFLWIKSPATNPGTTVNATSGTTRTAKTTFESGFAFGGICTAAQLVQAAVSRTIAPPQATTATWSARFQPSRVGGLTTALP
jgi:hypothetical protein